MTAELWKYAWCIVGIVISVVLPPLWALVKTKFAPPDATKALPGVAAHLWELFLPYIALGAASCLTSILLIAVAGDKITTAAGAVLAGYAWDSTLQKLK